MAIPARTFLEGRSVVSFDAGDPDGAGSYRLTDDQAHEIAARAGKRGQLPPGLDFFLEGYTA